MFLCLFWFFCWKKCFSEACFIADRSICFAYINVAWLSFASRSSASPSLASLCLALLSVTWLTLAAKCSLSCEVPGDSPGHVGFVLSGKCLVRVLGIGACMTLRLNMPISIFSLRQVIHLNMPISIFSLRQVIHMNMAITIFCGVCVVRMVAVCSSPARCRPTRRLQS